MQLYQLIAVQVLQAQRKEKIAHFLEPYIVIFLDIVAAFSDAAEGEKESDDQTQVDCY